jgi:hypothetical protein
MSSLEDSFRNVLEDFTKRLTNQELETFKLTSLQDLQDAVGKIQAEQAARRESMNMTRIRSFLEAAEQFGSVVEVFLNTTEFLAFVWGPMKFLLVVSVSKLRFSIPIASGELSQKVKIPSSSFSIR